MVMTVQASSPKPSGRLALLRAFRSRRRPALTTSPEPSPQTSPNRPRKRHEIRHPSGLGIDLELWAADVRRIVRSVYGLRICKAGLDPDDVLSEVYRRILVANRGRSAYDPGRGAFSAYVTLQTHSALRNLVKTRDRYARERTGMMAPDGVEVDVAQVDLEAEQEDWREAILDIARDEQEARALTMMAEGESDEAIQEATGCSPDEIRERFSGDGVEEGASEAVHP